MKAWYHAWYNTRFVGTKVPPCLETYTLVHAFWLSRQEQRGNLRRFNWISTKSVSDTWSFYGGESRMTSDSCTARPKKKVLDSVSILLLGCFRCWAINSTLQSRYSQGSRPPRTSQLTFNCPPNTDARCFCLVAGKNTSW